MKIASLIAALLFVLAPAAAPAQDYSGTWIVEPSSEPNSVQLYIEYKHAGDGGNEEWQQSGSVPLGDLRGLSAADLDSAGKNAGFGIVRDAGTLQAGGWMSRGRGSGTWTFQPNPSFAGELRKRGIGTPDVGQQFRLTLAGFQLATLDVLLAAGLARPSIGDLVSMGDHGVTGSFAASVVKALPGTTVGELISLRDHGVGENFISELARLGYRPSAVDLIRLRDHGVSASFIQRLRSHGYTKLTVDDLIRLRDNGF